jgi:hypothetical protein
MQMVLEHNPGENVDLPLVLQKSKGVQHNLSQLRLGENRQPRDDRLRHKMRVVIITESIA